MDITPNVALILAAIAPVTTAVYKAFELALRWQSQRHEISLAREDQAHKITTDYLDRALDPETGIAKREQLLRFLSAEGKDHHEHLRAWAKKELEAVDPIMRPLRKEVEKALASIEKAKDATELRAAEAALTLVRDKEASLLAPPKRPPITEAAIRAGAFSTSKYTAHENALVGVQMPGTNLQESPLTAVKLMNANFEGTNLAMSRFRASDLRGANLNGANLQRVNFGDADLRGATLVGADLTNAVLLQTHLESADLTDAKLNRDRMTAFYDAKTKWPDGYNPDEFGGINVDAPSAPRSKKPDTTSTPSAAKA